MRERSDARPPTILVIDDEEEVRQVLEEFVVTLGYAAVTASTGVAGLAALERDHPDAVLLDIAMPGALDGVNTLRGIKRLQPDLPIIMVTANSDVAIARSTLRDGAFDYVTKPLHLDRLREVLSAAMMLAGKLPPE